MNTKHAERDDETERQPSAKTTPKSAPKSATRAAGEPEIVPMQVGDDGIRLEGVEQPSITSLTPDTAVCGDVKDITMVVEGTGFHPKSVIVFGEHDEPTKFISATQVSTGVKPSLFVEPDAVPVTVRNAGFAPSNEMPFTFTDADAEAPPASRR